MDFETIQNDKTGAFTDGGPYLLIYSRVGSRPHGHSREEQQAAEEEQMDIESTSDSTDTLPTVQRGAVRPPDLLMDDDEGPRPDGDLVMAESESPQQLQVPAAPQPPKLLPTNPFHQSQTQSNNPFLQQSPPKPQPLQQSSPQQTQQPQQTTQEVDMQESERRPQPHHAHTTDDKSEWELVESETEKPNPVHRATR